MSLDDDWFIDYDSSTLDNKLIGVNFGLYAPAEREIPPQELNKIEFSLVKFESILMRHFVTELSMIHSFFNTEALVNENINFQRYARKMLNFTKAEINYCYHSWQHHKYLDYVVHRLNATLLRTYYFLLDLHKNLLKLKPGDHRSFWNPKQSLESLLEHLVVRYQDLVSLLQYFEKSFEELYHKIEPLTRSYPLEVNLIVAIWTLVNMFTSYNYNDIVKVSASKFSPEDEATLKQRILDSNSNFRKQVEEVEEKTYEEEQSDIQNYLMSQMMQSTVINRLATDSEKESYFLVGKALANNMIASKVQEDDDDYIDAKTRGNFLERLRNNVKENKSKKEIETQMADIFNVKMNNGGLSSVSTMKFSTLSLSQLGSVKESPNNPLAKNNVMHSLLSDAGEEHDLRAKIAKDSKLGTRQGIVSHFNRDILTKLGSDSDPYDSKNTTCTDNILSPDRKKVSASRLEEEDEYLKLMNSKLSDGLYKMLLGEKEDKRDQVDELRLKKGSKGIFKLSMNSGNPSEDLGSPERGRDSEKINYTKDDASVNEDEDTKSPNANKKVERNGKKKLNMAEEEFLKIAAEALSSNEQLQYVPAKENRGDDIPDEVILKDMIDAEISEESETESSNEGSDDDDNKSKSGSEEDGEKEDNEEAQEKEKRRREREKREKMKAQQNISKNQFQKFFQDCVEKETKNNKSKYYLPRRNFYYLGDDDNINACRHSSKWCFLQDNYKYQSIEKDCHNLRLEDYSSKHAPMTTNRDTLSKKSRRNQKTLWKSFVYAKENPISIFQNVVSIMTRTSTHRPTISRQDRLESDVMMKFV